MLSKNPSFPTVNSRRYLNAKVFIVIALSWVYFLNKSHHDFPVQTICSDFGWHSKIPTMKFVTQKTFPVKFLMNICGKSIRKVYIVLMNVNIWCSAISLSIFFLFVCLSILNGSSFQEMYRWKKLWKKYLREKSYSEKICKVLYFNRLYYPKQSWNVHLISLVNMSPVSRLNSNNKK